MTVRFSECAKQQRPTGNILLRLQRVLPHFPAVAVLQSVSIHRSLKAPS
jgi:hypothetical protein